ncbi:MAG: tandem-95 repeat protein [Candidatus Thiodiazotropha sp. (ex Monitilora ramsayi)]|nr:tandem-95 repeat protein [Candidatus Thiodiazotropha sp. (ex Monitilora ramsayi)]
MYHSGTNPQLQVYMGLYGAVTKDAAAGEVYPGVAYDNAATLFYSDIDPAHNAAVAAGTAGYTPIHYSPNWFLINGEPYVGTTADIPAGVAGESTLLRFLSAAGEKHVPVIQGMHGTIHAEDGIQYTWQNPGGSFGGFAPREQYSIGLPPLKTKDVIINPTADGRYAVYDGNGYMTNPSDPDDPLDGGDTVGGMLRFLEVGASTVINPVAVNDAFTATEDTLLSEAAPGVLVNDTDATTPEAQLVLPPANGNLVLNTDGSFDYTPNLNVDTTDSFTYQVLDTTTGLTSNVATVSIDITAVNDAPSIVSSPVLTATVGELYNYDVDATDPDTGDMQTYSLADAPIGMTIDSVSGLISWTPGAGDVGGATVAAVSTDAGGLIDSQSFAVTVEDVVAQTPPTAVADAYSVDEDAILDVAASGVLGNDIPTDGDAMTATLVTGPSCAWTAGPSGASAFVLNADGSFHYEPIPNWNSSLIAANPFCPGVSGPDSFTYQATDNDGNSNTVTVEITVNEMNDAPIAAADTLFMTAMGSITFPAPSVLDNDGDVDLIPFDPSQVFAVRETNPNRGNITGWPLNGDETSDGADGTFTYNFPNGRVGVVTTFDYHAIDSLASSNTVTVTIRRELSVKKVECENDTENGICKYVIEGRVSGRLPNGSTTIEAWLNGFDTGTLIGSVVETGGAAWNIQVDSTTIPVPGDTISVRAVHATDPDAANAFILDFPVTIN